jgi:hypothetical protein
MFKPTINPIASPTPKYPERLLIYRLMVVSPERVATGGSPVVVFSKDVTGEPLVATLIRTSEQPLMAS